MIKDLGRSCDEVDFSNCSESFVRKLFDFQWCWTDFLLNCMLWIYFVDVSQCADFCLILSGYDYCLAVCLVEWAMLRTLLGLVWFGYFKSIIVLILLYLLLIVLEQDFGFLETGFIFMTWLGTCQTCFWNSLKWNCPWRILLDRWKFYSCDSMRTTCWNALWHRCWFLCIEHCLVDLCY